MKKSHCIRNFFTIPLRLNNHEPVSKNFQNKIRFLIQKGVFPFLLLCCSFHVFSQGATCGQAEPFCSNPGSNQIIFPNTSSGISAEVGPNYGCLATQPNPAWYFLQIGNDGDLDLRISQNTQADGSGTDLDVDFICWGPFTDTNVCDGADLSAANTIGCSFSPLAVENFTIPNAQRGEIYLVLITNFSALPGFITLDQVSGAGSTDCSIVAGNLGPDQFPCEGDTVTLDGTTAGATSYAWFLNGTLIPGETLPTLDVTTSGNYTVEVMNGSGATDTDDITITFVTVPVPTTPPNLELCDVNDPGNEQEEFDLSVNIPLIMAGIDPAEFTLSYHGTQADADTGDNPLPNLFTNVTNSDRIHVRVESVLNESCFDASVFFDLIVNPLPSIIAVSDFERCDDDLDGNDTNGLVQSFDFSSKDAEIINGQANTTVQYYANAADAMANANALVSPYSNTTSPEIIFYRIENTVTGCFDIGSFNLVVNPLPVIQNTRLEQCDGVDGTLDGLSIYNLEQANPSVITTGVVTDYTFTYYLTLLDAQNQNNPQPAIPFTSVVSDQIIFVRAALNATGCARIAEIELGITTTDITNEVLEACDDDTDGLVLFDLSLADAIILNPAIPAGSTVAYYETLVDAQLETNPLPQFYSNTTANVQTIFTRVEDGNSCFGIGELELRVNPLPNRTTVSNFELCGDPSSTEIFDLSTKNAEILNGQDPLNFTVSYHLSNTDADAGANPITTPYNGANGEEIWTRVENNATGCFISTSFELIINMNPVLTPPTAIEICDDTVIDGFAAFDLTTRNAEIIGGQTNINVSYHISQNDADTGNNPLPDTYTNITNPQMVFIRLENSETNCFTTNNATLELIVQEGAEANAPTPLEICDETGPNDGIALFDLSLMDNEILGAQDPSQYRVSYHLTESDAEAGINEITGSYTNISNPQIIFPRVTNIPIGCFNTTMATLIVHLLPEPDLGDRAVLCVDGTGSILSSPTLDTGLSTVGFTYEWRFNGNILPGENQPTIVANMDGVYNVRVTDGVTGCQNSDEITVIRSSPPITFSATVVTPAFTTDNRIEVSVTGEGNYEFRIDDEPFQEDAFFERVLAGPHTITIQDTNGCGSAFLDVFIIDYPRFFTPNGDGINDTWTIIGARRLDQANVSIFDRFGKLLKQFDSNSAGWDGVFNGQRLPSSDYWFLINFVENDVPRQLTGHFTLKR